jgi:hypothetical protein
MIRLTCAREKEVVGMVRRGQWPQACPTELRAHVAACRSCGELVLVTQAFQSARMQTALPRLESAGALWWRAQLRRRSEAIERIGRPILGAQIFALAVALVLGVGLIGWALRQGFSLAAWIAELPRALHLDALLPASFPTLEGNLWLLVPLLATIALVSGVIVYLTTEKQ